MRLLLFERFCYVSVFRGEVLILSLV